MTAEDFEFEDPLAAPPVAIRRTVGRTSAEAIRMVLAQDGVPATVERDRSAAAGGSRDAFVVIVSQAAAEDAERTLANRAALASGIDWDEVDVGEMSERDARLLAAAPRRRRIARWLLAAGSIAILVMVVLGLLAMIADLIPSSGRS
jgi:hypothetical protein